MKNIRPVVYQNLSTLLASGVPILRALQTTGRGVRGKWRRVFNEMHDYVAGGNSLAEAMAQHRRMFLKMDVLVVETGEISGNLPQALELLSDWYKLLNRMKALIRSGMILPVLLIHFMAVLGPAPTLLPQLIQGGADWGIFGHSVIRTLLVWFYIPAAAIWAVINLTPQTGITRRFLDEVVMMVPLLGKGIRYQAISRYCRAFSMFISAGVDGVESARKATEVTGNGAVANCFKGAAEAAKEGKPFSEGLSKRLPLMFREQWMVGEETGQLDEITRRLADSTAETAERAFKEFSVWFPRIVYFIVLFKMASMILQGYGNMYGDLLG